jgi:YidC/Oxa1 family membrane protein insertase
MYQVFIKSLNGKTLEGIYSFVKAPASINPVFLHFLNLSHPNAIMAVVAGILQYIATKMTLPKTQTQDQTAKIMSYQTLYFLPAMTIFIGLKFPAGLALYWIVTTLFGIGQQYYILRKEKEEVSYGSK